MLSKMKYYGTRGKRGIVFLGFVFLGCVLITSVFKVRQMSTFARVLNNKMQPESLIQPKTTLRNHREPSVLAEQGFQRPLTSSLARSQNTSTKGNSQFDHLTTLEKCKLLTISYIGMK